MLFYIALTRQQNVTSSVSLSWGFFSDLALYWLQNIKEVLVFVETSSDILKEEQSREQGSGIFFLSSSLPIYIQLQFLFTLLSFVANIYTACFCVIGNHQALENFKDECPSQMKYCLYIMSNKKVPANTAYIK
jgi:hypothetical protein